jgi:hypothetical protein
MTRRRSRRSYGLELLLTVALVAGVYLWMTNGGPEWFGSYLAGQMVSTPRPSGDTPNEGHGEPPQAP